MERKIIGNTLDKYAKVIAKILWKDAFGFVKKMRENMTN